MRNRPARIITRWTPMPRRPLTPISGLRMALTILAGLAIGLALHFLSR